MLYNYKQKKESFMNVRSEFLIHWTGNNKKKDDIESKPIGKRSELYLERLIDYYENGLFSRRKNEPTLRLRQVKDVVRLCFTEIKLSQVQTHASRYGKLGIGFNREFILQKGGRPVIYIPYNSNEESRILENNLLNIKDSISVLSKKLADQDSGLKELIDKMSNSLKWVKAYIKRMGERKAPYIYLEEMEWRIVYDESDKHFSKLQSDDNGVHRLCFKSTDVKIIIFPDDDTKKKTLNNRKMQKYFSEHMPIMATLTDCKHF